MISGTRALFKLVVIEVEEGSRAAALGLRGFGGIWALGLGLYFGIKAVRLGFGLCN